MMRRAILTTVFVLMNVLTGCNDKAQSPRKSDEPQILSGQPPVVSAAMSYTPYDAVGMLWSRSGDGKQVTWTGSGGEAGKLLISKGDTNQRPSWILCSQGVVSGLAAKGEKVVILATVYKDADAILPVFRKPRPSLNGAKSLFIPRSSIELAFDNLLKREGVNFSQVSIPKVENVSFPTIASLLQKDANDKDAIDFGILVEPFITNIMQQNPNKYEIGKGGLYELHYNVVARLEDVQANRGKYLELLRQLINADQTIATFPNDDAFYKETWGRKKDGNPENFPKTLTYRRSAAKLQLQPTRLRQLIKEELTYLTQKYPEQLKMPENIDVLVDPSLLQEVAPDRVIN